MGKAVKDFKGRKIYELNFNKKTVFWLNLLSLPVLIFSLEILFILGAFIRGEGAVSEFPSLLATFVVILFGLTPLHEALHGLCFWAYTKEKPKFGFKWWYAYAAAPEWYFTKQQYIISAICPLIIITFVGIVLFLFVPASAVFPLTFFIAANIAGSVGDIYVSFRMFCFKKETMVKDWGKGMAIFCKE